MSEYQYKMDGEEQLFALFWKCLATVICTLILSIAGYNAHSNYLLAEIMKKVENPALAKCAIDTSSTNQSAFCIELARQGAK